MNVLQGLDPYTLMQFADIIDKLLETKEGRDDILYRLKVELRAETREFEAKLEREEEEWYNMKLIYMGLSPS